MRLLRLAGAAVLTVFVVFALLSLTLRFLVLPQLPAHRDRIAAALSKGVGAQVEIDAITTGWLGWNPKLVLEGLRLREAGAQAPAIDLPRVELVASWTSILHLDLRLRELAIDRPVIAAARDAQGRLHVAGLEFDPAKTSSAPALIPWILRQREIVVRDATIAWTDELRAAPTVTVERVDLRLTARRGWHRFGVRGTPPADLASPFDVRGEVADPADGDWARASGSVYLRVDYADVAAWRAWTPVPDAIASGQGALRAWCEFAGGAFTSVVADAELADVRLALAPSRPPLALAHLAGRVEWTSRGALRKLQGRGLVFTTPEGTSQPAADFAFSESRDEAARQGDVSASRLDLAAFAEVAASLPLPVAWSELVARAAPRGHLVEPRYHWEGDMDAPRRWKAQASLDDIGVRAGERMPGIEHLTGTLAGDQDGGTLEIGARAMLVQLPRALPAAVHVDTLDGTLRWRRDEGHLRVDVDNLAFANADIAGTLSGHWRARDAGPGEVDFGVAVSRATVARIPDYVPAAIHPQARAWLKRALVGGNVTGGKVVLAGDLAEFPFERDGSGRFEIVAEVHGGALDYADHWPRIEGIDATLKLDRLRLLCDATRASVLDAQLGPTHAEIPDVTRVVIAARGSASGDLSAFLDFLRQSPVGDWTGRVFDAVHGTGNGRLDLALSLPLSALEDSRVDGRFAIASGAVEWPDVPRLEDISADVGFERTGVTRGEATARVLGGPVKATLDHRDGALHLAVSGNGDLGRLRETYRGAQAERIEGVSDWTLDASIAPHALQWRARSSMQGASLALPAPFGKPREGAMPLSIERRVISPQRDQVVIALADAGRVTIQRKLGDGDPQIERTLVLAGKAAERPGDASRMGLWIRVDVPQLDLDPWLALDLAQPASVVTATTVTTATPAAAAPAAPGGAATPLASGPPVTASAAPASAVNQASAPLPTGGETPPGLQLAGFEITSGQLSVLHRHFRNLSLDARRESDHWQASIKGVTAEGTASWYAATRDAPNGRARVRLVRLSLPYEDREGAHAETAGAETTRNWPEIDLEAAHMQWRGREVGALRMRAQPAGSDWQIHDLALTNDGGTITSQAMWHTTRGQERTDFSAQFDIGDAGVFLAHFGSADQIRGAPTKGQGTFSWPGAPSDFDATALDGELTLTAGRGQFLKIDPGIGRLLGVLSLQSLPRRITLDFRDVFSEGFAFDEASTGRVHIDNGVMRTDEFRIAGPAARVTIRGEVDLAHETQALDVRVLPSIATGVSAGAAMLLVAANPIMAAVVGAGTLLAQKALKDPIEQLFSYQYRISGSWTEPLVQRVGVESLAAPGSAAVAPASTAPVNAASPGVAPASAAPAGAAPAASPPAAAAPGTAR